MTTMALFNLFHRSDKKTDMLMEQVRARQVENDLAANRFEKVFKRVIEAKQGVVVNVEQTSNK